MSGVVSALTNTTTGLTSGTILAVVTDLVPLITMMVPVALGIYFLRKLVNGISHGKVRF